MNRDDLVEQLRSAGCVFAEDEADLVLANLGSGSDTQVDAYVERRRLGEPSEYILGWADLAGVRVAVGPGVFIPRPWSESLVLRAAALLGPAGGGTAIDLGTGSGAIALAIRALLPDVTIWATEIDHTAARWAEINFASAEGLTVRTGDLYDALPGALTGCVDVIVGSLPYVPGDGLDALPRDHLVHEPLAAFDGGDGGLATVRRAIEGAPRWLRRPGYILLEIGVGQGASALGIAAAKGFTDPVLHRDSDGGELFIEATLPG